MDEKIDAGYYGILPANVRYDKKLKAMEKIMFTEITCLSNKYGYCYAKNKYFADLYEVSKETVSRWISNLVKYNYISRAVKYKDNSKEIDNRFLTINPIPIDDLIKGGIDEKINRGIDKKIISPIDEKIKDNSTSFSNNININIDHYFNEVWKLYPKKLGKGKVSKLTKKSIMKIDLDSWKVIINRYNKSIEDKTFLMHGSTFFNSGYVDFTDENFQQQKDSFEKKKYTNTKKYDYAEDKKKITDEEKENNLSMFSKFKKRG